MNSTGVLFDRTRLFVRVIEGRGLSARLHQDSRGSSAGRLARWTRSASWRRRCRMSGTIVSVWMVAAAAASLAGCEMSATSVSAECRVLGSQCRLASGPLGVCENVDCKDGQAGPCFHCSDQH